ncbi:uncharacterized protein LOC108732813 [Agrilus planipennis]|uniref:Uncharacterized protein LOC108732813 n=1 Tax=Agrilus planipennis TaxID=224129 RepID=A0A1W4WGY6_AGRPL|nr:uncharacterized protein LOC108732813 [Agrilus planipennis]
MEEYVRDNFKDYDLLLETYGGSTPCQNKNDNLDVITSDSSNGNDQNINKFGNKIDSSNKLPPKPSLVKKLSNIILEEKNTAVDNTVIKNSSDKVSNNYPEHGPLTYPTSSYPSTQNTPSSVTPSSIPPQNMSFFSTTMSPKISTSRRYPISKKRNSKKVLNPTRKVGLSIANFNFEDSLMSPGPLSQSDSLRDIAKTCAKQPQDKLNHDLIRSTNHEERPRLSSTNGNYRVVEIVDDIDRKTNNLPESMKIDVKSISWRSPLVSSPHQKYSPNVSRDNEISKLPPNKTTSENNFSDNAQETFLRDNFTDFLSTSLLETIEKLNEQQSNVQQHQKEPPASQQYPPPKNPQHPEKRIKITEYSATAQKYSEDQLEASTRMSACSVLNNTADSTFPSEQISSRGSENNCSFTETFLENRPKYDPQRVEYDGYYSRRNPDDFQEANFDSRRTQCISQYNNPRKIETPFPTYEPRSQQNRPSTSERNFYHEFPRPYTQHNYPLKEVKFIGQSCHPPPSTSCCCHRTQCRNDLLYDRSPRKMDYYYEREPENIGTMKRIQPNSERYPNHNLHHYDTQNEFQMGNRNPRSDFIVPPRFVSNNNNEAEFVETEKNYTYQRREPPCRAPRRNVFEEVPKTFELEGRYNINHQNLHETENFVRNRYSPNFNQMVRPHSQSSGDYYQNPSFPRENNYQRRFISPSGGPCTEENTQHNFSLLNSNENIPLQVRYSSPTSQYLDSHHPRIFP